ncbi:hypothetical protein [Leminorella grimontii]|uniref:hypothetical protein n=1 Tax=Leminorella grimontii TaxID=82981 RepID=UPI0032200411
MVEKVNNFPVGDFSFQNSVLDDFRYSSGSLELFISNDDGDVNSKLRVLFDWVHSFRLTDEGDLLKMLSEHNGHLTTGIHLIENSRYLAWFNEESANVI